MRLPRVVWLGKRGGIRTGRDCFSVAWMMSASQTRFSIQWNMHWKSTSCVCVHAWIASGIGCPRNFFGSRVAIRDWHSNRLCRNPYRRDWLWWIGRPLLIGIIFFSCRLLVDLWPSKLRNVVVKGAVFAALTGATRTEPSLRRIDPEGKRWSVVVARARDSRIYRSSSGRFECRCRTLVNSSSWSVFVCATIAN